MIAKVAAVVARADNAKAICNFFLKRVYYFSCFCPYPLGMGPKGEAASKRREVGNLCLFVVSI